MKVLVLDVGGSHVKIRATGQTERRKVRSGPKFTAKNLVEQVKETADGWDYEAISLGYPGQVDHHGPRAEPPNLGPGWVGFDFAAAFGKPVKILNDAAMQALGSYEGGRMLFLGLGTGLGSALVSDRIVIPLELGALRYHRHGELSDYLGKKGYKRLGLRRWRKAVGNVTTELRRALVADYVVLGGGNAERVKPLPEGARLGDNENAFVGGFRLWDTQHIAAMQTGNGEVIAPEPLYEWRQA